MPDSPSPTTPSKTSPASSGPPGADDLADRVDRAVADEVKLLALTLDERAIMLSSLEDPPKQLAELRAVFLNDHGWRQREGLD